ncbi:META domain-containing protein [Arsukibacterium indicum]|uniref:META domain-containing protein n=1 Tax=Arsukibacterium indicum TaxID=2848612 RepID=A0ABS6MNZ3_9GAMM|nr:META domain-containing protein [Arsukibacterium indicum]MBV2130528.1 META domain-containing protein [Arsukibacterium indicum]
MRYKVSQPGSKCHFKNVFYLLFAVTGIFMLTACQPESSRPASEPAQQQSPTPAHADSVNIAGKWQLTELQQQPVDPDNKVFLQFDPAGRVTGYTGCNSLTGTYQLQGSRLSFGPLATTRKACLDETVEPQLLDVLNNVDNISIAADQLSLNRARMAPLARFSRVPAAAEQ